MSSPLHADCLALAQNCDEDHAMASAMPCGCCAVAPCDPGAELAFVDMARALEDFDSNAVAVNGLLRDFLADRAGCMRKLAGVSGASRLQAWAVVHDVANTLDAGWCRLAALAVRRHEDRLHRDAASPVGSIVAEVEAIVRQAFDGVRDQLARCAPCRLHATA